VYLLSSIFLIALLWNPVKGSRGDTCKRFVICMRQCSQGCNLDEYPGKLPIYLTVFWWDCTDECKYLCMHNVTANDVRNNKRIKQFYGKVSNCICKIESGKLSCKACDRKCILPLSVSVAIYTIPWNSRTCFSVIFNF